MSEYEYLEALDRALMVLSQPERQEVLDDYRQHFREGRAAGKADAEIAQLLGEPAANATQYLSDRQAYFQYPYTPKPPKKKPWGRMAALAMAAIAVAVGISMAGIFQRVPAIGTTTISSDPADLSIEFREAISSPSLTETGLVVEDIVSVAVDAITYRLTEDVQDLDFTESYSDIDEIVVDGGFSLSCHIASGEGPDVGVTLLGQIPTAHKIDVSTSNGKLKIRYRSNQQNIDANTNTPAHAYITVPKGWSGRASVSTVAGDLLVDEAGLTRLEAHTSSGNVFIRQQDVQMERLQLFTASGDVELDLNAGRVEAAGASGDVSGRLWVDRLEVATASGEIDLTLAEIGDRVEIATVSGSVDLALPAHYDFGYETLSGRLSNLAGLAKGSTVSVATVSGDLTLQEIPAPA